MTNGTQNVAGSFIDNQYTERTGFLSHVGDHFLPSHRNNYRPHLLANRLLALFSALLITVKITGIVLTLVLPATSVFSSAITPENIFLLTNVSRKDNNLPQLTWNGVLAKAAQAKAEDMASKGYFAHTSPDGRLPWDFITAAGYDYVNAGENLAEGFFEAETTEEAWMNSPGHRANILNKNYREIGIGQATGKLDGHNTMFVVQMFGSSLTVPAKVLAEAEAKPVAESTPSKTTIAQAAPVPVETVAVSETQPPKIVDSRITLVDNSKLKIFVTTNETVVKSLINLGDSNILLDPKGENTWEGFVNLNDTIGKKVTVEVSDIAGNKAVQELASISNSLASSYGASPVESQHNTVTIFGYNIDWNSIESGIYLFFASALIAILILAIGIKRHVQHIDLIANASFVVVLAVMLYTH